MVHLNCTNQLSAQFSDDILEATVLASYFTSDTGISKLFGLIYDCLKMIFL